MAEVLAVLLPVLDIVEAPVEGVVPPPWYEKRAGWAEYLLGLDEAALELGERHGLAALMHESVSAPRDLRELVEAVRRCTRLPRLLGDFPALPLDALRGVRARKREQVAALLGALSPLAQQAARIVDVGSGSGHFSRLAAELFERETWALDRDARRLQTARARSEQRAKQVGDLSVHFIQADLSRNELQFQAGDLAVGLHACGELGDRLVDAARRAGCDVALVSCCLQKRAEERRSPLSRQAAGLNLGRSILGLTNLTAQAEGVEASLQENLEARETRLALRYLLRARGVATRPGEEMRGINRRRAHAGLGELARQALLQRQLGPASPAELRFHADSARQDYARMRRLSLPRNLLARLVEIAVALDRAVALEEFGQHVCLAQLFEQRVTPRNTVLFASADPGRLPSLTPV